MNSPQTRRTLLKGVAAGAVAVGWSAATGTWATAANAAGAKFSPLPPLDGVLETAPQVLADFSADFGKMVTGTPRAVLRPGSVQDIVKIVRYARANRLTVAMNGQSGNGGDRESHSSYGQAAVPGGISIDAGKLATIHRVGATSATVDAGVTWAALLDAALTIGRTPPALPDYCHLSIGGTTSVGGIGGTVQKHGLLADTVQEIDIVTGEGQLVTASAATRPELFFAALAGAGQVGIIVRATVRLIPAQSTATVMNLFYDDLSTFVADQEKVLADGRFSHQSGEIVRRPDDSGWRYKLEAVTYHSGAAPDPTRLLTGLRDDRAALQVVSMPYRDWILRLDPYEVFLKQEGFWSAPKPWLSLILPASAAQRFIREVTAELTPGDLGAGFAGVYPFLTSKITRPLVALPDEKVAWLVDLLRFPPPGDPNISAMLAQNRRLYDRAVALGGKRYLVGAIPGMTVADWRAHFGAKYLPFRTLKRRFDPDAVLTPGAGFFQ